MSEIIRFAESERGGMIGRAHDGKIALPSRVWHPGPDAGEYWQVELNQTKKGTAYIAVPIRRVRRVGLGDHSAGYVLQNIKELLGELCLGSDSTYLRGLDCSRGAIYVSEKLSKELVEWAVGAAYRGLNWRKERDPHGALEYVARCPAPQGWEQLKLHPRWRRIINRGQDYAERLRRRLARMQNKAIARQEEARRNYEEERYQRMVRTGVDAVLSGEAFIRLGKPTTEKNMAALNLLAEKYKLQRREGLAYQGSGLVFPMEKIGFCVLEPDGRAFGEIIKALDENA